MRLARFVLFGFGMILASEVIAQGVTTNAQEAQKDSQNTLHVDGLGDPLPRGAVARLGTRRWRTGEVSLAFSPNSLYVIATGDRTRLMDPLTGVILRQFDLPSSRAFFCSDNKTVMLAGGTDGIIHFLDVETGREVRKFPIGGFVGGSMNLKWSADGKKVACLSVGPNKGDYRILPSNLSVWDIEAGKKIRQWNDYVGAFALSHDGKTLALHEKNQIYLSDVDDGKELRRWESKNGASAFSPDGKLLTSANGDRITLWDPTTGKLAPNRKLNPLQMQDKKEKLTAFSFSFDGRYLAASSLKGTLYVWDLSADKLVITIPKAGNGSPIYHLTFSPNGKTLISHAHLYPAARLWDIPSGKEISPPNANTGSIERLAFSLDGKTIVTVGPRDPACLWNAGSGELIKQFPREGYLGLDFQDAFVFQTNGKSLARNFRDYSFGWNFSIWNVNDGENVFQFKGDRQICPDGWIDDHTLVAVFPGDFKDLHLNGDEGPDVSLRWNLIGLLNTRTNQINNSFRIEADRLLGLKLSSDGKILVATGIVSAEPEVRCVFAWDLSRQTEIFRVAIAAADVNYSGPNLSLSPDGRTLYSKAFEGLVRRHVIEFFEVASGKIRLSFEHKLESDSLSPSPSAILNEHLAAVASRDKIYLIDLVTGKELRCLKSGEGWIRCLAFTPDGKFLASGSSDTTGLVWDISDFAQPPPIVFDKLTESDLKNNWTNLVNDDAMLAYRSVLRLSQSPKQTVPFLKARLQPAPIVEQEKIKLLVFQLDNQRFIERERATQELLKLGQASIKTLVEIIENPPSLEANLRAKQILRKLEEKQKKGQFPVSAETLREVRVVETLERIGTPEAVGVLTQLTKGSPFAVLTRQARESLQRLSKKMSIER
jgi:WD40 repeat protein